jgi:hypothetical protein
MKVADVRPVIAERIFLEDGTEYCRFKANAWGRWSGMTLEMSLESNDELEAAYQAYCRPDSDLKRC